MSVELLDKTRKINRFLYYNTSSKVVFNDICKIMTECLNSNVMVLSGKGKVLGCSFSSSVVALNEPLTHKVGAFVDRSFSERILNILSTQDNVNLQSLGFNSEDSDRHCAVICPIIITGERLGTIFMYRGESRYGIDDIILSEYASTVVGLEILRSESAALVEEERSLQIVKSALGTMSSSELAACVHIFDELDGDEGVLVASKVADKAGITRSVIVNALRKFESAGVIEAHSGGMKGTYIKIKNRHMLEELNKLHQTNS